MSEEKNIHLVDIINIDIINLNRLCDLATPCAQNTATTIIDKVARFQILIYKFKYILSKTIKNYLIISFN